MTKENRVPDRGTLITLGLFIITGIAFAWMGVLLCSWALLAASGACLLICIFYILPQRVPKGLSTINPKLHQMEDKNETNR